MTQTLEPRKIIAGALVTVLERRGALARALLLPALASLLLGYLRLLPNVDSVRAFIFIPELIVQTIFAVTTHRILLLGSQSVPKWGVLSWSRREMLFLLQLFLVPLCVIPAAAFLLIPYIGVIVAVGIAAWIISRLSLVFPATAVYQPLSIFDAWSLSRSYQLPLLVTVVLFPFVLCIPIVVLAQVPMALPFVNLLGMLVTVLVIASLSLTYSEIRRLEGLPA